MEYLEKLNAKLVEVKKEIDNFEKNISELKEKYPEISAYELATKSNVNGRNRKKTNSFTV